MKFELILLQHLRLESLEAVMSYTPRIQRKAPSLPLNQLQIPYLAPCIRLKLCRIEALIIRFISYPDLLRILILRNFIGHFSPPRPPQKLLVIMHLMLIRVFLPLLLLKTESLRIDGVLVVMLALES